MESAERINRLLNYKTFLYQLRSLGFIKVFSDNIADALGISASLVRKDFGVFGIVGSQKGGYEIEKILEKIQEILGKDTVQKIIIVGVGRIGTALLEYKKGFDKEGIKIVAGFDIDPATIDPEAEIPVYSTSLLYDYIQDNHIQFAIVSVPESAAQQTLETLKAAHIYGILNFTTLRLKNTEETIISNINIEHELSRLIYFVKNR
ncbi:redox-sensing transcriptional repressor Rex [candidate division KSB1 bacterium]|nr:redox-sensing transcriptional repressor Rex [candidate division KSB1 bacterium]